MTTRYVYKGGENMNLVEFRVKNNLTQREISQIIGTTLTYYSKIELGLREPSYNFIKKFKIAFNNAKVDEIFFNKQLHKVCSDNTQFSLTN